jgi:hypothetical protein
LIHKISARERASDPPSPRLPPTLKLWRTGRRAGE